ncbi:MAG: hypothetical protein R3325_08835 [Thermoanaerobaculia bacterium]|nr:hypothetical protein [Thermoanaerobaculia bacterium]
MRPLRPLALAPLLALLLAAPAPAAELRVHYRALEKMMLAKAFDAEGRLYLQPALTSKCRYVYISDPVVGAADGRLLVQVRFHTLLGVEFAGQCRGAGDSFPAVISGVPVYRDGELRLDAVRVDTEGRAYGEAVKPMVDSLLSERLIFPLKQRIEESSEIVWQETGARMSVPRLEIGEIQLGEYEMRVEFDFRIVFR